MPKKQNENITEPIIKVVYNEYKNTIERSRSFDTRAGIFITFLIASFPLYLQIVDLQNIKGQLSQSLFSFVESMRILCFFVSIALFLSAFITLVCVLSTRRYLTFDTNVFDGLDLDEYKELEVTQDLINVQLISDFNVFIMHNSDVVEKKAKRFTVSLWLSCSYVITAVLTIILIIL